ncbi:methylated-DNA--protein-cysteine methyltransferase [Danaus plexippus]|uniref:methylated-DNA--protein-cysteine methyltransferase n=1 Tax=Danaus plexippus TaxID=13037 RepID=UPI002AAFBE8A|nr:methylated-DNA--protein-cysteine methyltransferase [Danaus plexippus]
MEFSELLTKFSQNSKKSICILRFDSPIGKIVAAGDDNFLYVVVFEDSKNFEKELRVIADNLSCSFVEKKSKILEQFECEIKDYFDGNLRKFTVPIKTFGTDFQKEVWKHLLELPYGSTQTYGSLAKNMGRAASHSRAIGAACGANAHLIIIPCHRLVASATNGGFSCGVNRKEWLIEHEKKFVKL